MVNDRWADVLGHNPPVIFSYQEFDLSGVRTYALASRNSKAKAADFGKVGVPQQTVAEFIDTLPNILGGADFKAVVRALQSARAKSGGIIWGIGAHVIKTGVSPVIIDLMERGYVSALAMNGAGVIHDFEIALSGATSEDVDEAIGPGRFGMAEETGGLLNAAVARGAAAGHGLGQAVAGFLAARQPPYGDRSLLVAAHRAGVPVTVHVAIGTDIIHMHP